MKDIEKRILAIESRNKKVELDKAWETSNTRKLIIATLTYVVIVLLFFSSDIKNPFVNAIVPTLGFLLSTLSLSFFKKLWLNARL